MYLNDLFCKFYVNSIYVLFEFLWGGCGSRYIILLNKVMFFNRVFIVNKLYYKIIRRIMIIYFFCKYRVIDSIVYKMKGFL